MKTKWKNFAEYFSMWERLLWLFSVGMILLFFLLFDRTRYITLAASVIGVTSLIFNAKGNPFGQFLMIVFSALYGYISYAFAYYGEMITYLGMTAPMALVALIAWLRNPYGGNHTEVAVNHISRVETGWMLTLAVLVTLGFYFVLDFFHTAYIILSAISVTTSFVAVYLTFRRSPYFALAYAANDVVLILLWVLAAMNDCSYVSVITCFVMFLINDLYGFANWMRMKKRQFTSTPFY